MGLLFILYTAYFGIIILLFLVTINKRRNLKIAIPTGIIFTTLVFYGIYTYKIKQEKLHIALIEYLGYYRLNSLDGKSCKNCKVRLLKDNTYQIIVQDKIIGFGKWNLESAPDIPFYFLEIENGPNNVISEDERLIDYINRKKE